MSHLETESLGQRWLGLEASRGCAHLERRCYLQASTSQCCSGRFLIFAVTSFLPNLQA